MGDTHYPNGLTSRGIPLPYMGAGSVFGKTYFVDPTNGSDGNKGRGTTDAFKTFTKALATAKHCDTINLAKGGYVGNFTTPINAIAAFVTVLGNEGTYFEATTASSPVVDVLARGWRWSGIEFDNPTGAAGLRMTKAVGLVDRGADFFTVDNCLFYGGKTGIEFNGGGTYWKILRNRFSLISTAGGGGVYVGSSSYQIPALGKIEDNVFDNTINHIYCGATRGFSDTTIKGNTFKLDGVATDGAILCDIRGSGAAGGNSVVGNYFDITKAQYTDDASTAFIRTNATDFGAGNYCNDGAADAAISV